MESVGLTVIVWQPFSRRRGLADDTVCFQLGDLGVAQPDFGE